MTAAPPARARRVVDLGAVRHNVAVPRGLSGSAEVGRDGQVVHVAGRVSMDQLVVDVGDVPLGPGDEVTVVGTGQHGEQTVAQWAERAGTIPYEILTGLGRPRTALEYV